MRSGAVPVTGTQVWTGAALVVTAVLAGVVSLRALVAPGAWLPVSVLVTVGLAALLAAVRSRARSRVAPSAAGGLAVVLVLASLYGNAGTGMGVPMPTPETARRLGQLVTGGIDAIVGGKIPVDPTRGLELVVVASVALVVLGTDAMALGAGRAGASGLLLAALFVPAAIFDRMPNALVLVVAGTSFLLLLTVTRPPATSNDRAGRHDVVPALATAAAVTVLALALGPLASVLPFYGSVSGPQAFGAQGIGGPLRLSTDLDMRSSLAPRSDRPLLRYTTDGGTNLGPLRMYTMTDFDGTQWRRGSEPARESLDPVDGVLWPDDAGLDAWEGGEEDAGRATRVSVRVGDLDQDRLPIPVDPRSVDTPGRWLYDPVRDEVVAAGGGTRGLSYVVDIDSRDLSAAALERDSVGGSALAEDSPTLEVPQTPFTAEVAALAAEVTADAGSTYEQALALQMFLRDTSAFRYSTRVPDPVTEDAVYDFLNDRTGYCVQFATAMAVMARSIGIPARLGVGFLPGRANPEVGGEFVVTARQSHAWPELYFQDAGWVRFEPTPAVQTGAPPAYADPFASSATPTPTPSATSSASASTGGQAQPPVAGGGAGGRVSFGDTSVPLGLVLLAAVLLIVLTAASWVLVLRRRRAVEVRPSGPEVAWGDLREVLGAAGVSWPDSATPRLAAEVVRARYRHVLEERGAEPAVAASVDQAAAALDGLVTAVESERYAPEPAPWDGPELDAMVATAAGPVVVRTGDEVSDRARPGAGPSAARGG